MLLILLQNHLIVISVWYTSQIKWNIYPYRFLPQYGEKKKKGNMVFEILRFFYLRQILLEVGSLAYAISYLVSIITKPDRSYSYWKTFFFYYNFKYIFS